LLQEADAWIYSHYYTAERLKIERLSGDPLPMAQYYINLAIIEYVNNARDRSKEKYKEEEGDDTPRSSPFSLTARLKIDAPDKTRQVDLSILFDPRKGPDGQTFNPRRI
jgi:hypothetical protein